jgi:hypothetical protein
MKLDKLTRFIGRNILLTKKNSPHIFFAVGIVGAVGATVLACRATLKLEETVDEIKEDFNAVNQLEQNRKDTSYKIGKAYTEDEHRKDLGFVYAKSSLRLVKLYGPSVVVGGLSIFALTGSHVQLTRRNTALTVTLVGAIKAFDEYRERVRTEVGEKREAEIHSGAFKNHVDAKGKTNVVNPVEVNSLSNYARMFDWTNINWREDPDLNRLFINVAQNHANYMLNSRGHFFLNDAYDALGLPRTKEGSVVGWAKSGDGDRYVDFGFYELNPREEFPSKDHCVLLDFNVDGVVYHLIGEKECQ